MGWPKPTASFVGEVALQTAWPFLLGDGDSRRVVSTGLSKPFVSMQDTRGSDPTRQRFSEVTFHKTLRPIAGLWHAGGDLPA